MINYFIFLFAFLEILLRTIEAVQNITPPHLRSHPDAQVCLIHQPLCVFSLSVHHGGPEPVLLPPVAEPGHDGKGRKVFSFREQGEQQRKESCEQKREILFEKAKKGIRAKNQLKRQGPNNN